MVGTSGRPIGPKQNPKGAHSCECHGVTGSNLSSAGAVSGGSTVPVVCACAVLGAVLAFVDPAVSMDVRASASLLEGRSREIPVALDVFSGRRAGFNRERLIFKAERPGEGAGSLAE